LIAEGLQELEACLMCSVGIGQQVSQPQRPRQGIGLLLAHAWSKGAGGEALPMAPWRRIQQFRFASGQRLHDPVLQPCDVPQVKRDEIGLRQDARDQFLRSEIVRDLVEEAVAAQDLPLEIGGGAHRMNSLSVSRSLWNV